jgi:hypothetical protein
MPRTAAVVIDPVVEAGEFIFVAVFGAGSAVPGEAILVLDLGSRVSGVVVLGDVAEAVLIGEAGDLAAVTY